MGNPLKHVKQVYLFVLIIVPIPLFTLKSHRSIVNSLIFHPHLPLIYTAGVEKLVRIFSPFPFIDPTLISSTQERIKGTLVPYNVQQGELSEDASVLNFFDMLHGSEDSFEVFDNTSESDD